MADLRTMRVLLSVCLLWSLASVVITKEARFPEEDVESLQDLCINVLCHTGQECIAINGNAACVCKESCPEHEKPVCGSNGMTYPNHCELHRTACLEEKKISVKHIGTCKGQPTQPPSSSKVHKSKPVVCYEHDRDEIRSHLIGWLKNQEKSLEGVEGYRNLLQSYFDMVDDNKDGKLDATEFRGFITANQSIDAEVTSVEEYINPILQSLCADALISISDEDSDWELSINEFMKCLDPEFKPPKRDCELDDEVYSDGTEIPTNGCNSCVCACGQWVCTALKCETEANQAGAEMDEDQGEEHKFIVNGEEAKEQLTREILEREEEERAHQHQRKVLPLHKSRQHNRHRKHGKHGSRETGRREE